MTTLDAFSEAIVAIASINDDGYYDELLNKLSEMEGAEILRRKSAHSYKTPKQVENDRILTDILSYMADGTEYTIWEIQYFKDAVNSTPYNSVFPFMNYSFQKISHIMSNGVRAGILTKGMKKGTKEVTYEKV